MRIKRSFISIFLCLALLLTSFVALNAVQASAADTENEASGAADYGLMSTVQGSTILQAWDWSFKNVEANLEKIAEQGFTTVQVSPASVLNGTSAGSTFNEAWKVYQPGVLKMNGGSGMPDNNVLGTKAEFTSMCNKAHSLGIKIIVDTVVNHLGGDKFDESDSNPLNHLTADGYYVKNYQNELYNRDCFHDYYILSDWNDDWQLVKFAVLNLPDLNTSNTTVQTAAYNYLDELIQAGADGFRFDAAKHIETPNDRDVLKSDFWTNTLKKVQQKYSDREIYAYGEILGVGDNRQFSWYTNLMDVTDSGTSDDIRGSITNHNNNKTTPSLPSYVGSADQILLWTESHDNFEGGSYGTPEKQIGKIWALEAGRANATCLYFGRPGNDSSYTNIALGTANQTGWANETTKAVNQFHNHFYGQSEYNSTSGNIACIERGSTGAVLVDVSEGNGSINIAKHTLEDGSYTDAVSGNTFSVGNGKISGSIGSTGVAVIYKDSEIPVDPVSVEVKSGYNTVVFTNNKGWGTPNIYYWGGSGASSEWPGTQMEYCGTNEMNQKQYVGYVPTTCKNIIINDGTNQSADYTTLTGHTGLYLTDTQSGGNYVLGTYDISSMLPAQPSSATEPTSATQPSTSGGSTTTESVVYLKPNSNWLKDGARFAAYFFGTSGTTWVGMSADTVSGLYKCTIPSGTYENLIFCRMNGSTTANNWDNKWNQTNDLTISGNVGKGYVIADGTWDMGGGEWKTYVELGGTLPTEPTQATEPPTYDYTVVYTYDGDKTITKTVNDTTLTDVNAIAELHDPSSTLKDMEHAYSIDSSGITQNGTTINVPLTKTIINYSVYLNGTYKGSYGYLERATVTSSTETTFLIDGKAIKTGKSFTFFVTGNINVTTNASATRSDVTTIVQTGQYITDTQIFLEMLATANIGQFKRMGVAFVSTSTNKTDAEIKAEILAYSGTGTKVTNKVAVHNSAVDTANVSGLYQFRYAPYMNKSVAHGRLKFFAFAVTESDEVILSGESYEANIDNLKS